MSRQNVFVLGWDEFNFSHNLDTLLDSPEYDFHQLLTWDEVKGERAFTVEEAMDLAERRLREFPGSVDAIVGYWDFPGCLMVPLLCDRFGLPGVSPRSAFACEHKYWARVEQARAIDEHPPFAAVDPFVEPTPVPLDYPFWVKPVVGYLGQLGFRVESEDDWRHAMEVTRRKIHRLGEPCDHLLQFVDPPPEVRGVGGHRCVAEGMLSGWQLTVEGYAHAGDVQVYGVVDSHCHPGTSVFERLQYPSHLPDAVRERSREISRRFLERVEFDHGPFNIEYYWDREADRIGVLEINARISQSHSNLFKKVDGVSHHKAMVELGLGQRPEMPVGGGRYATAAKFMLNSFEDGIVRRAPTRAEIAELEREFDAPIRLEVREGVRLSELVNRDEYSYPLADVWMGGADDDDLRRRYEECVRRLPFGIEGEDGVLRGPVPPEEARSR